MTSDNTGPEPAPDQISLPRLYSLLERHADDEAPYDVRAGLEKLAGWMAEDVDEADTARQEADAARTPRPSWSQVAHARLKWSASHRAIVAVDIEGSTARTGPGRARLRHDLFGLLDCALREGGIGEDLRDPIVDRGDGAVVLVRPAGEAPKSVLLTSVVPELARLLAEHNAAAAPGSEIRLRVAVHAGEVRYDNLGPYGEDLDVACRLLDSPELKRLLRHAPSSLVLVASDSFHRTVIRHNYDGIDPGAFKRGVVVRIGGRRVTGWTNCPDVAKEGQHLTA
ncbi:hypothetical protein [Amycolatopsis sp. NPDC003676]